MSGLRKVAYTDTEGRLKVSLLPDKALDIEAPNGVPVGPPSLEELNLPKEIEVRLNNELYNRGIITAQDAVKRRPDVLGALMAALKVDAGQIVDVYIGRNK
jgi:hypothetical protein